MDLKSLLRKSIRILFCCFILFQIYVFIRFYWLTSCVIPTYSVSPALTVGDYTIASLSIPGKWVIKQVLYERDIMKNMRSKWLLLS